MADGAGRGSRVAAWIIVFCLVTLFVLLTAVRGVNEIRLLIETATPAPKSTQKPVVMPTGLPAVSVDLRAMTLTAEELESVGLGASHVSIVEPIEASEVFSDRSSVTKAAQDKFVDGVATAFGSDDREARFGVDVRLIDYVNDRWARPIMETGEADAAGQYPAGSLVSRSVKGTVETAQVRFSKGRIRVQIAVHVSELARHRGKINTVEWARGLALLQYELVPAVGNLDEESVVDLSSEGILLGVTLSVAMMLIGLGSQAASALWDAGTRETLRPRRRRDRSGPNTVDLTRALARRRRRVALASILKSAAVMITVATVYFGTGALRIVPTLLVTALALLALTTVIELLSRLLRPNGFHQTGGIRVVLAVIVGNALSLLMLAVGALGIVVGAAGLLLMRGAEFVLPAVILFFIGVLVLNNGARPLSFLRRLTAPQVAETVKRDNRAPILLLRSFQDDDLIIRMHRTGRQSFVESLSTEGFGRFEEMLAWVFWRSGPVLAIGQPGTTLQALGAARAYYADDDWQDAVRAHVRVAQAVVFVVGRSPGLLWEIGCVREDGALARALFIFPPEADDEIESRVRVLASALSIDPWLILEGLGDGIRLVAVYLREDGVPLRVVADGRDDLAYEKAFEESLARTGVSSGATLWDPAKEYRVPKVDVSDLLMSFDPQAKRRPRVSILRRVVSSLLDIPR